ncbi:MAG TPA: sugar phosphate isomerase/epimerase [Bacilli bacterium]|nr:sugar phosphate isomerase/epimerase [Bacilli bacterium]
MKKNIFLEYGFNSDYRKRAKLIKAMGFDGVFLEWNDSIDSIAKIVREEGLEIETIHLPYALANSIWEETPDGEIYYQQIIDGVLKAGQLKINTVIVHTLKGQTPPSVSLLGLERMKAIVKLASEKKVHVALENIRLPEYFDYFFENIPSPWLRFCFDAGHANCFSRDIEVFPWEKYQSRLICVHLHDNFGLSDQHQMPFTGNINWEKLMKKLKEIKYPGPLTLEVVLKHTEGLDEDEFIKTAKATIDKLAGLYDK